LNSGKFYGANVLILGGDITGKMIVSIVNRGDGTYSTQYTGVETILKSKDEVDSMVKNIRDSGFYPYFTEPAEIDELNANPELVRRIFKRLMVESITSWTKLAEDRLKGTGIKCYISPGNDDIFDIDDALNSSSSSNFVMNPEEKVVDIDGQHEMITLGYANRTPWNSPREVDEEELARKIERMASQVKDMSKAIFNIHVPPINTPIDQAPQLDKDLKPVMAGGQNVMISAGSTATRSMIEKYQPLVGFHGHIHESKGLVRIGRTVCFNPGSEYGEGILRGVVCLLDSDKIKAYQLTSG
jgi:Icc-related predicted phosphoesterase